MWFPHHSDSQISARRRYVKWWRRDCWDSALTSSSPLNNPVIIPFPPGWAGNFPAKQHKQQQQKIIIHGDVPVFFKKEVVKSARVCLSYVSPCGPARQRHAIYNERTTQTDLCDLKPPRLMGTKDETEPCAFADTDLLGAHVHLEWEW